MIAFFCMIYNHILRPFCHYVKHHIVAPMKHYYTFHVKKPFKQYYQNHIRWPLHIYMENHTTYLFETKLKAFLIPSFRRNHRTTCEKVHGWVQEIEQSKDERKKMTIVFLCQYYASWNAYMSTFRAAVNDPSVQVYLLALPEKKLKSGEDKLKSYITHEEYGENAAFSFCKSFYPETINAYDATTGRWFNIGALSPDYVFIQRPFQMYLPPQYRCTILSAYTKICYLPYSYCKQLWDSRSVYRFSFMNYVYAVFVENESYYKTLKEIYENVFHAKWKQICFFGYPRFDMHHNSDNTTHNRKTVLWLPRWTTSNDIEATTFFKYKDILIKFFCSHPEYKLICRPHPKTWGHFIAIKAMSEIEVGNFKKLFEETENFELDESGDYLPTFEDADIFVSDTSSLLVEEFSTGKPIIFCGNMGRFDKTAKEWMKYTYPVSNEQELIDRMTKLIEGEDPTKEERSHYVLNNMKHDGKCGERILNFLKEDYKNTMPSNASA